MGAVRGVTALLAGAAIFAAGVAAIAGAEAAISWLARSPHATPVRALAEQDADAVAFSPGGKLVATSDALWDAGTGQMIRNLSSPGSAPAAAGGQADNAGVVAFSPDGRLVATGGDDWTAPAVFLWDVASGRLVATLADPGPSSGWVPDVVALAFNPDGTMLATSVSDAPGTTYVWNLASRRIVATLTGPGQAVTEPYAGPLAFSPDGTWLAVGYNTGRAYVWDVASGHRVAVIADPAPEVAQVSALAFSPSGDILATGDFGSASTYLWRLGPASPVKIATLAEPEGSRGVQAVAFSPSGDILASGDRDGNTFLWREPGSWSAADQRPAAVTLPGRTGESSDDFPNGDAYEMAGGVNAVSFSHDGTMLATDVLGVGAYLWKILAVLGGGEPPAVLR